MLFSPVSRNSRKVRMLGLAVAAVVGFGGMDAGSASATIGTWIGASGGTWSTATNWDSNPNIPSAAGDTANLTGTLTAGMIVSLNANETLGTLNIGATSGSFSYTLSGGSTLTMNNGSSGAYINENSTSNGDTISAPIVLGGTGDLTITSTSV